jgi:hypothetical protein
MPFVPSRILALRCATAVAALAVTACAGRAQSSARPAPPPKPPQAVAPMDLAGQKVLVLPTQAVAGIPQRRDDVTNEVLFALGERTDRVEWISPERLRSALRTAPGYAESPDALPADAFRHHNERYIINPLAGLVRRYSALMDARLVLIIHGAQWLPAPAGAEGGMIRISATMVEARTGNVVWWGDADGQVRPEPDSAALATAAASLVARMVIAG